MIDGLPPWISALFAATVLVTIVWFHAAGRSRGLLAGIVLWTILQCMLGLSGFYQDASLIPPRIFIVGVLPTVVLMAACFLTERGRRFVDAMDLRTLTWLHTVRIPVEVTLWLLVEREMLSEYMSIGGTNFDILSGITAPIIAYLAFRSGKDDRRLLLIWNVACTLLLLNVVLTAALGIPSPIQQHSFDQPNAAVLYFPFNLLPTVVVPLVLFAHLIALRRLRN